MLYVPCRWFASLKKRRKEWWPRHLKMIMFWSIVVQGLNQGGKYMKHACTTLLAVIFCLLGGESLAHPGSGIVADKDGNIYFVDTGSGVYKLAPDGTLTRLSGPAYHWMAIDIDGRLKNISLPYFNYGDATVVRVGADPALLLSSDFPVTVGTNGNLFYPWIRDGKLLQFFRLDPSGTTSTFASLPANTENTPLRWVNGAVAAADGSLFYTEDRSVRKINSKGEVTVFASNLSVSGCESIPGIGPEFGPYLRGIDVDAHGSVYVAAAGCGAVLKITADKKVTAVLRSSRPWSPTGVALSGNDLYVLEYLHTEGDDRCRWIPRIRKVTADGSVVTVATIKR